VRGSGLRPKSIKPISDGIVGANDFRLRESEIAEIDKFPREYLAERRGHSLTQNFEFAEEHPDMQKTTTTPLGHAVRAFSDGGDKALVQGREHHSTTNSLRDVILGGQDGLVNMLGIALGVVAAGGSTHVLIVTGLAAAITESISMGAVAYTSFGSDRDFYFAEKDREQNEIETQPDDEREEVRAIYAAKGFKGQLLEDVVSTITANRETWVSTMMNEELHLQPVAQQSLVQSAVIVTVATLIGHFIPIVPFMVAARTPAIIVAIGLSAVTLFAVGVYSAKTLVGDWRKSGLQMVAIGLGAAALGFLIGRFFHTVGG
jgi:predicted membrane protein (TIGR00267 family)